MQSISAVSAESAEGIEEIARASTELSALTDDLQALVDEFIVEAEKGRSGTASPARRNAPTGRPDTNGEDVVEVG